MSRNSVVAKNQTRATAFLRASGGLLALWGHPPATKSLRAPVGLRAVFVLLLLAGSLGAQTANVIELDPQDTARAQKAWDALQKAQSEWDATRDSIGLRYAATPGASIFSLNCGPIRDGGITCQHTRPGFENGFEFSKDFKYIVPKSAAPSTCIGSSCGPYLQYNNGMVPFSGGTFQ